MDKGEIFYIHLKVTFLTLCYGLVSSDMTLPGIHQGIHEVPQTIRDIDLDLKLYEYHGQRHWVIALSFQCHVAVSILLKGDLRMTPCKVNQTCNP